MPKEEQSVMPAKVPLLVMPAMVAIVVAIIVLISAIPYASISYYILEWFYAEEGPTIVFWVVMIPALVMLFVGLPVIMVSRLAACLILAIDGILWGLLLYASAFYLALMSWI